MEFLMSIKSKIAAVALVAMTAAGAMAATTQAQAKGPGVGYGIAAGLAGAAIVGGAVVANNGYYGYERGYRCGYTRQYDLFGNYMGRVRTCNY
jgi:hypothetical protein